jgi:hypothetical protein
MAHHREVFYGLVVQDGTEFNSDWCSVFCLLGEKRRNSWGLFT